MSRTSREVRLAHPPAGLPTAQDFTVVETAVPEPGPGELLVRNLGFQVFGAAVTTALGQDVANFPGLHPGGVPFGPAVGEVVAGGGFAPGDLVSHGAGWREFAVLPADRCAPLGDALPDPLLHLSHGWTGYAALTRIAPVRPGDAVFVSNAAGAIGSLAGRIARLLGAGRVVGSVGSPEKARRLVDELGYDAAVLRGEPLGEQLAAAAPDGLDVVVDLVGGEQLRAAVEAARPHARIALTGALTAQYATAGPRMRAPVDLDLAQLILKSVRVTGFRADDHPDALPEWNERFASWLRNGEIDFPHTRISGIDRAPRALEDLLAGRHVGAVLVEP
ncbi:MULTISPECIES: NADP-dependent oxidoreductase [unclassified Saccharopolyspora]|uniref:MDR family NADP-dependent oxidoreductase n=1 Tax=unclassified Saccharopolyspora TaxID=2646250 RepID=UPI001CD603DC|nr:MULTISPECIES: NADP-dependent oxidoreductase [unclassified Saccharopolyspora]MCA1188810.1 NADP-dependent oxidoreductase [Saccharopolyspora sp. 6T]MCA1196206.1 NADP-dependent oxidoreductase [Saccharopolyspora sp. 6V]MCA1283233.1 NADP-dependent oxidoreductase [Saccharopolyspora sp. 7B]